MKLTRNFVIGLAAMLAWVNLAASQEEPKRPAAPKLSVGVKQNPTCPAVTHIRFYPRKGFAQRMLKGRFSGSNAGKTTDFWTVAEIKETPPEGQWTEIQLTNPVRFRYIKYESPAGGWGNVAEVEFYSGDKKIQGQPFGTTGSRGQSGNDFLKAMDGNVETFFDGVEQNNQYVGIDLGPEVQAAAPEFSPKPGAYRTPQEITITSATPGAQIRIARDWGTPRPEEGEKYKGPIKVAKSVVLVAVAYTDQLAASEPVIAPYRIGDVARDEKTVRTFHIGNSLTDTVVGWLQPVATSAGRNFDFHRFTIPGAPTDWLWNHPGGGFGDCRYPRGVLRAGPHRPHLHPALPRPRPLDPQRGRVQREVLRSLPQAQPRGAGMGLRAVAGAEVPGPLVAGPGGHG